MQYACSTTDKSTYLYFTYWNKRKSYTSKNETKLLISEQTFKFKTKLFIFGTKHLHTVCPRRSDPFNIVIYYIK